MADLTLNQFLMLYMWFPLAALLGFLTLIGRFYQKFSNRETFFRFFIAPLALFGAVSVRYASIDNIAGDTVGDILFGLGGILLIGLCIRLYRLMITLNRSE